MRVPRYLVLVALAALVGVVFVVVQVVQVALSRPPVAASGLDTAGQSGASATPPAVGHTSVHIDMVSLTVGKRVTAPLSDDPSRVDLSVFVTLSNGNDVPVTLDLSSLSIVDGYHQTLDEDSACGYFVDVALTKVAAPALCHVDFGGTLNPGQTIYGSITYKVPTNEHTAYLVWAPSSPQDSITWPTATWRISY